MSDQFIPARSFGPGTLQRMCAALDGAWHQLVSSGDVLAAPFRAEHTRAAMALKIITMTQLGERSVDRLQADALTHARGLIFEHRAEMTHLHAS